MTKFSSRLCSLAIVAGLAAGSTIAQPAAPVAAAPVVAAPSVAKSPAARPAAGAEEGIRWQSLSPPQREALKPLEREWSGIDGARKQKWVSIANRFNTLSAQERTHISERMTEWARLTPSERGEVRMRFQEAQQVPASDRSARWQAYQKLPPGEKQQFAARAAAASAAKAQPPRSDPAQKATASRDATQAKANVVTNPALVQPPRQVAPTIVQATPGATTRFITRRPTPPAHQQAGMPKIAATPEFVNRSTLLPKRGPQAAGIGPSAPTVAKAPAVEPTPARPLGGTTAPVAASVITPAPPIPAR